MKYAILASGQSLNDSDVSLVKKFRDEGNLDGVIAISNVGIDLAPWADALVSHDAKWWANNLHSNMFKGRKFCRQSWPKCEVFVPDRKNGCNSGYMAMQVARDIFKAKRIILLGFDMRGTHYFGKHPKGLKNTDDAGFTRHIAQFNNWTGCEVVNCTVGSALKQFPFLSLPEALEY